jgi:hypothetical protein
VRGRGVGAVIATTAMLCSYLTRSPAALDEGVKIDRPASPTLSPRIHMGLCDVIDKTDVAVSVTPTSKPKMV